ncbi:uncharacterized protein LOC123710413 [Pieris brassicae]|uniref:Uncharacterized protein n=1 Tax=Pieris brassicae TaxID=7116 RepID=A0A9P0TX28_PIEBR|nr:uncharacterized protein LOC123710413 [Pieris brassicae]CAH4035059.1 unnamed protein product [Pieris brassicae]
MENCLEESDIQVPVSPPRRRRSTFFVRRESLAPALHAENKLDSTNGDERKAHNEAVTKYYNALLYEKSLWKEELIRRRDVYQELRLQCKIAQKRPNSLESQTYSVLNAEDIEFLNRKINLSQLIERQQGLHKSVKIAQAFYRKATELENVILTNVESKIDKIHDYIFENSTMDFVEN